MQQHSDDPHFTRAYNASELCRELSARIGIPCFVSKLSDAPSVQKLRKGSGAGSTMLSGLVDFTSVGFRIACRVSCA